MQSTVFKHHRLALALAVLWVGMAGRPVTAQEQSRRAADNLTSQLQRELEHLVSTEGVPGATLAVSFGNRKPISLAAGFADPESESPMPTGGRMLAGSTGKTFVSAVALQLIAEDKLKLDDRVSKWLADKSDRGWFERLPNASDLTVRSLMTHTSGLPRYIFQPAFLQKLKSEPLKQRKPRECLRGLLDGRPLHPTGKGWAYSDTNYILLGLIIEKITGRTYYAELRRRILQPHRLLNTSPSTQPRLDGLVLGHMAKSNPFGLPARSLQDGRYVLNPAFEWCGGGVISNVDDLARWMRLLHSGKVLAGETYALLIQPSKPNARLPGGARYGLGTMIWESNHGTFLGHSGMMPGYLTQIEYSQKHGFAVALQVNTDQKVGARLHQFVQRFANVVIAD